MRCRRPTTGRGADHALWDSCQGMRPRGSVLRRCLGSPHSSDPRRYAGLAARTVEPRDLVMASADRRTDYRVTFFVLCVGVSSFSLLQSMVNPVLPTIQAALDTDQATVTWVLTAYLLSASVFTPIVGRVGDKVGKERMLVVALAALAVGSLLAAVATSVGVLIAARVVQGVGGGVLPLTFGIIPDEFPRERVAGPNGTAAALLAVGRGFGLVIPAPLVDALSYHWLFWLPMLMTLSAAIAAHFFVPESP